MTIHIGWDWLTFVVLYLALSGLIVFARGVCGFTRTYTLFDAIFGAAEIGFLIWIVVTKL